MASSAQWTSSNTSTANGVQAPKSAQKRLEDVLTWVGVPAGRRGCALPPRSPRYVEQRSERTGSGQSVARTPRPAAVRLEPLELLEEEADTGLSGDEDQAPAAAPGIRGVLTQGVELRLPLQ